jgi:SWI/SNF-related matrix-associated actin-dependent regulator 1 of chromatin subfamily A
MRNYIIDSRNKTVRFEFDFDKDIITRIKQCSFNSHWNPELKFWIVPVDDWSSLKIKKLVKDFNFIHKVEEVKVYEKYDYSISDLHLGKMNDICKNLNFQYTPRNYQVESLYYGLNKVNFINGDDVGIGKSLESILYAESTKSFPCLVVVPASIKYDWKSKWLEIISEKRTVSIIESKETSKHKNNWDAEVVVINYDILGKKAGTGSTVKFKELLDINWKMFIFDEGHFLKEESSQRSKAAKLMTKKSDAIIQLLTGTAVMSKPSELWNLLVIIKKEKLIADNWKQFITRYCGAYQSKFGLVYSGATNTIELNNKLREHCYLRREKREVMSELPDVTKIILKTKVTNIKDINHASENLIEFLRETKGDEDAERAMEAESLVALGVLRKLSIVGKLQAIEQFLKDWKLGSKKLLVFGIHREELDYLSEKFKSKLIAGGISSKKKQDIVTEWINNDEVFLFANIQSAGTGVDGLQKVCSNMLILELPWRPSDLEQTIGRLDRSGQSEPSTIRYMLSDDSIDKEMWEMLASKEANTEAVNKGIDVVAQKSGMRMVMQKILQKSLAAKRLENKIKK